MKPLFNNKDHRVNYQQGEAAGDLLKVVIIVLAVGLAWIFTGGPDRLKNNGESGSSFFSQPMIPDLPTATGTADTVSNTQAQGTGVSGGTRAKTDSKTSSYSNKVRLERGTAGMEEYTMNEYVRVVADDSNDGPVNITGWRLGNGGRFTGSVEYLTIPTATKYFSIKNPGKQVPVLLDKGQSAVVTIGKVMSNDPFAINTSFQVNKCSGYLSNLGGLKFRPNLPYSCPGVNNEPDANTVTDTCLDYFRTVGSCTNFRFDSSGRLEYINNRYVLNADTYDLPPTSCIAYAKEHFGYEQCLVNHKRDKDFLSKEWRVFLKMSRRFWYSSRDRITLYDKEGKLVDQIIIP